MQVFYVQVCIKKPQMVIPFGQLPLHRRMLFNHANFVSEKWLDMTFRAVNSLIE